MSEIWTPPSMIDPGTGLPVGLPVGPGEAGEPRPVMLEGRFVTLSALDLDRDLEGLHAATHHGSTRNGIGDPTAAEALWRYLPAGPFATIAEHRSHIEQLQRTPGLYPYVLRSAATDAVLGRACLMRMDRPNRVIEVGHILYGFEARRTPATTEAMYLLATYVFETLGYRRYEWKCDALNAPSRAAALRLGFSFEGIFRQAAIVRGHNRDTAWFSMLDGEWPALKARFERWLDPANFDADGRQRRPLGPRP